MMPLWIFLLTFLGMWPSFFILLFVLFRQKVQRNLPKIMLCSFFMAQASLLLQSLPIGFAISIIQPLLCILCLRFIFKFNFFYSLLMTVIIYSFSALAEVSFNLVTSRFNMVEFIKKLQETVIMPAIYLSSIQYLLSIIFYKIRLGFSFIPIQPEAKIQKPFNSKWFILLGIGIIIVFSICMSLFLWNHLFLYIMTTLSFLFFILLQSLYYKEIEQD